MKLEDSLNGGYGGLYGEVVDEDSYHVRDLDDIVSINDPTFIHRKGHKRKFNFIPDVVLDLGANVGVFSRYARQLFPNALIIAVEPDKNNCDIFKEHTSDERIILIEKAIGDGEIFKARKAANGSLEVYMSKNIGYDDDDFKLFEKSDVQAIKITKLKQYINPGDRVLLKLDIEGNETSIFSDAASMKMLSTIDYIAGELHFFANDGLKLVGVVDLVNESMDQLRKTHDVEQIDKYFFAVKR